jgi:hypothetical protein
LLMLQHLTGGGWGLVIRRVWKPRRARSQWSSCYSFRSLSGRVRYTNGLTRKRLKNTPW